jgi:hypothetical protein
MLGIDETSTSDEVAEKIRTSQGESYEMMGEHIEFHHEQIGEYVDGCSGPLKMRAAKAGRVVTVTVCNSPAVFDGGTSDETVHIQRDRIMGE